MKILATLTPKPGTDPKAFGPLVVDEEKQVWADYESGLLREMYFQPDPVVVTLVFEAQDKESVSARLATYPMVAAGLFEIRVVTLGHWAPLKALFRPEALA